ncbi:alpha/beta hydrolase [Occultella glacieicola]|uniref:Alpha/beta hydrolase n=1 Tax=Occultella glacieicola TaxID=2518684 RepID=A0ABY2E756_9MICO|nr:alpha/beta hydrolase [Occultella glacieicola]TDE95893.1 alpha/beta hydrolase [Occultella glacieicola]
MDAVDVDGIRIAFTRAGRGRPIVLLGGFVGDGAGTWHHQIDALSGTYSVVSWDPPGSGGSSDVPESFRLPEYATCLAGLISTLGLRRPVLVGLSFGGALAIEYWRQHGTQVRALFLAGAYAGWAGSLPAETVAQRLQTCLAASVLPAPEFASTLAPSMFSDSAPADRVAETRDNIAAAFRPGGFRAMALSSAEADLRDVLPRIDVPTLVLHGEADVRAPRFVADALSDAIPGSRLVVLPGVGHVSCIEAPGRFTTELETFLREIERCTGP